MRSKGTHKKGEKEGKMDFSRDSSTRWLFIDRFQVELQFGVLVFEVRWKPENLERNNNQQQKHMIYLRSCQTEASPSTTALSLPLQ